MYKRLEAKGANVTAEIANVARDIYETCMILGIKKNILKKLR
jgi:hypothetical protein